MKTHSCHRLPWRLYTGVGLLSLAALSSCQTASKTASIDYDYIAKTGFVMAKPIVVDIDIEKRKIEGRGSVKNSKYGQNRALAVQAAKDLAVMDAVQKGDADIVVQPIYETESTETTTLAIVTGYAGKYKDFREIAPSDTTAFAVRADMGRTSMVVSLAAPGEAEVPQAKKGGAGAIVLALLAVGLLTYALAGN